MAEVDQKLDTAAREFLTETLEKIANDFPRLRVNSEPERCGACGRIKVLKKGFCFDCMKPHLDRLEPEYIRKVADLHAGR